MENRERRPAGFQFQPHEINKVAEAIIPRNTLIKVGDPRMVQWQKATDLLKSVQNRAAKKGLAPEGSVKMTIEANPNSIETITETATSAGMVIDVETSSENPGTIIGSVALKDIPDLAIGIYGPKEDGSLDQETKLTLPAFDDGTPSAWR